MCGQRRGYRILVLALPLLAPAEDLKSRLERGLAAAQRGECAKALPDLRAVVAAAPRITPAHNAIGVCETHLGRPERATASFQTAVQLEPGVWQGWNNLGANYLALNRPEKAFEVFGRARKLSVANPQVEAGWMKAAGHVAESAAERINAKDHAEGHRRLALVREALAPVASWNNLIGYAEFKLGRPEAALPHLKKALDLEPDNQDYLMDLAEFLAWHEAHTVLLEIFEVAIRRMPHAPRVQFGRAVAYILVNRRDEATVQLERLLQEHARFEPVYRALGECYEDADKLEEMIRLGRQLQGVNPSNALGWYLEGAGYLGLARREQAQTDRAVAALRRALELDARFARAHFHLARAYLEAGDAAQAETYLKKTLEIDSQHSRAHYVLGQVYQKQGKKELARAELELHRKLKDDDRTRGFRRLLVTTR